MKSSQNHQQDSLKKNTQTLDKRKEIPHEEQDKTI